MSERPGERPPASMVSVVIPTLLRSPTMEDALRALATQEVDCDWEVILSVNRAGVEDESALLLRRWSQRFPHLRIVDAAHRPGVSAARNAGIAAARGDLVVICDDDDLVRPGWLRALVRAATTADLVGGALDVERLNVPSVRAWHRRPPTDRAPLALAFWPYAVGCNMAVWRDVWERHGGFDESWVAGCEEIEFSWRVIRGGGRVAFAPDAVVAYRYRTELMDLVRQVYRWGRAEPRLYSCFRVDGVERTPVVGTIRWWFGHLRRATEVGRGPARRGRWLRLAAHRAGRVAGCIRFRTVYL